MQPTPLSCPNCGAGLGPVQDGQYLCGYCGHRSTPPGLVFDQAQHAAMLAASLAHFEARRTQGLSRMEELRKRERDAAADLRRTNGYVLLGIGGLFLVFALACFAGAAYTLATADDGSVSLGPLVFGLFWLALGGGMFYGGIRYSRAGHRDRRLRERGLRGRATVRSYRESNIVLDGKPRFELVLQVEVPGRAPYFVKQSDWVAHPSAVTTGAELPVFVDPSNATDVMVDWFTAGG
jgi:hypothetical protein